MKVLVKLGGTLLDTPESRAILARQIAKSGLHTVVVHGGGKQVTRFLRERGIESTFLNGLRVTTPETMDAVVKVLAGTVNHELVSALVAEGARAVGLSGVDALLTEAEPMSPELGQVGRVVRSNTGLLDLLVTGGYLPVLACMAGDRQGRLYNVNADQMAVACAIGYCADQLIFLTDVPGVLDAGQKVRPMLTVAECERLIADGVATGGMLTKLTAAIDGLRHGVRQIRIAHGTEPDIFLRLVHGEQLGTRIIFEPDEDSA